MYADNDTIALALLAVMETELTSALSCAGLDHDPDPSEVDSNLQRLAELQGGMDETELENYGAAVAWAKSVDMLRTYFALGAIEGAAGDVTRVAVAALEAAADIEDPGSSLQDYAEDCLSLLAAGGFAGERRASPNDLLDLCGRTLEDVAMGDFCAAAGSLVFPVGMDDDFLPIADVASQLRQASRTVR